MEEWEFWIRKRERRKEGECIGGGGKARGRGD